MSLSEFLQQDKLFNLAQNGSPFQLKKEILSLGTAWFENNPSESNLIEENLKGFGFTPNNQLLEDIRHNIILHYYEKFLGLCLKPAEFKKYLNDRIQGHDHVSTLKESINAGRSVFLASCHFGAVEFIVPYLASHHLPLNAVLRFKTPRLSETVKGRAKEMSSQGDFKKIGFIEIGKPGSAAALEMAAVLRRKEILLSMFDEKTEYSKPVEMFGKKIYGGAGIDRILRFCGSQADLFLAFMVRTEHERYSFTLLKADLANPIESLFKQLEHTAKNNPEQWYFLHEEIPFV
ncbi:lipid A biosynthesis acyltransferase [Chitinispirillum alkaliphilum]|nr:lipid A biosynthesis acyltransferase [Chitinispirillum alkaliphilum]